MIWTWGNVKMSSHLRLVVFQRLMFIDGEISVRKRRFGSRRIGRTQMLRVFNTVISIFFSSSGSNRFSWCRSRLQVEYCNSISYLRLFHFRELKFWDQLQGGSIIRRSFDFDWDVARVCKMYSPSARAYSYQAAFVYWNSAIWLPSFSSSKFGFAYRQ